MRQIFTFADFILGFVKLVLISLISIKVTSYLMRMLYKFYVLTELYALSKSINNDVLSQYTPILIQYLMNTDYLINIWPMTSKSALMILNKLYLWD